MLIDQFTTLAQILNFLILVLLLRRFLFRPVLQAMQSRQDQISARLHEADQQIQIAQQEAESFRQQQQSWEAERTQLWDQAQHEIDAWRREETRQIKEEIETLRAHWLNQLEQEKRSFLTSLKQHIAHQVYQISRHVLKEMADVSLEEHLARTMIARLEHFSQAQWQDLQRGLARSKSVQITSSFDLHSRTTEQIQEILQQHLGSICLDRRVSPEAECGIEIELDGCKVSWTLETYLRSLEEEFARLLPERGSIPAASDSPVLTERQ